MSRIAAVQAALDYYDDEASGYFRDLAELVSIPTESQSPTRTPEMREYLEGPIGARLGKLGYNIRIYENPLAGCGPVMLATRTEAPDLATIICYGHGDVVLGMEGRWTDNRDPWKLSFDGDRVYGRGWGRVYEALVEGVGRRGGYAGTAGELAAYWQEQRCAS